MQYECLFVDVYWHTDIEIDNYADDAEGVIYGEDGPFASTAIKLKNGKIYTANCLKEHLKWSAAIFYSSISIPVTRPWGC